MSGRLVGLFALVGIPSLLYLGLPLGERTEYKSRRYAQETAALRNLQIINTAQVQYNSQFGRFARSLAELGPLVSDLIPADLATDEKKGYEFKLTPTPEGYAITAVPSFLGSTGTRTFYTDQSLIIRENYGSDAATADSKEVGQRP